jgi:6,7-dimethyl-8-ribityllumazine synthase
MAEVNNSKLLQIDAGILSKDACIVIVRTEWNAVIVDELEKGCIEELEKHDVKWIKVITVPGALEIPFGIKSFWDVRKYTDDRPCVFIALGCVIKGGTPHFEYVCRGVTEGITRLNLTLPVPVIFGVLTVDNEQQAKERIGGKHGHKGEEAAITALKMVTLVHSIKKQGMQQDS